MEKHIMGENGISYTLGEDGLYYPDLYLQEETEYSIGKYGMLRKSYLQEHRKELKMQNQMAWVRGMNNIWACAEEIIYKSILYR